MTAPLRKCHRVTSTPRHGRHSRSSATSNFYMKRPVLRYPGTRTSIPLATTVSLRPTKQPAEFENCELAQHCRQHGCDGLRALQDLRSGIATMEQRGAHVSRQIILLIVTERLHLLTP